MDIEFSKSLPVLYPTSWADYCRFADHFIKNVEPSWAMAAADMPFVLHIGLLKVYFEENGTETPDINNMTLAELQTDMLRLFANQEQVLNHYS